MQAKPLPLTHLLLRLGVIAFFTIVSVVLIVPGFRKIEKQTPPPIPDEKLPAPYPADKGAYSGGAPRPGDNGSDDAFLRTIIENNLFRPLGWAPPRPIEPYRLIGTIHPTDDRRPPTAILQMTAGDRTYIVTTGDTLDDATEVVSIQPKQVTLSTDGKHRTLRFQPLF